MVQHGKLPGVSGNPDLPGGDTRFESAKYMDRVPREPNQAELDLRKTAARKGVDSILNGPTVADRIKELDNSALPLGTKFELSFDTKDFRKFVKDYGEANASRGNVTLVLKDKESGRSTTLALSLVNAQKWQATLAENLRTNRFAPKSLDAALEKAFGKTEDANRALYGADIAPKTPEPRVHAFQAVQQIMNELPL
jgi:hypothetical protein